ncbi:MAG TPA: pyruvate:ferredoxin (flavodoxin) oxidoreductase [Anaerohalosphaeraceae bacterium]|nr:pyruvate:ferredoxin (flavodoxin) oxidoreductase [Anaerohalosphaeraceae bacterium]HPB92042.1 pyruvate:ferredoxin (flavodoxin) oxidoreductase [Anaerohalosphaeraceae bacterium]HRT23938.1 pyruvate:ferredoxin (flavodoxin) oxidoreductase [Anaerohalosphaeraceae bacterium]
MTRRMVTIDGNTAVAHVAHATNEVIAIYPITPSSPMGEMADAKSTAGQRNIWGTIPSVSEMQSEGGAAGAVHGSLLTGAMTTTFTASQGLLLMIPNMYKIAGELLPTVFHVSARSLACQALSIFGDHSDVMAVRQTGFAMLASSNVQEVMDMSLIAQQATLASRVPFLHFFDGFRTSHEVQKVEELTYDDMRAMIDESLVAAHKARALSPDRPMISGTAQNPDVYFQGRETVNPFYQACPEVVQQTMNKFAGIAGRQYHLFDYIGDPNAEKVIVIMGSGADVVHETVDYLNSRGEKIGLVKVRLYRPFSNRYFVQALPKTVKKIAVLDRTKEPGSIGEPLYLDVRTAVGEGMAEGWAPFKGYPQIIGGRYGLGSKDFTPAMVKAIFDNLDAAEPKNHFSVGIIDDLCHTSLDVDESFDIGGKTFTAMFYGLGSDGTVGANKNSIKIIGEQTAYYAQGYFVYDSKKAGAVTVSHLRFGPDPIRSPYLISRADFVACHNPSFLEKYDMLSNLKPGGTFLLTSSHGPEEVWDTLPVEVQQQIIDKKIKFYVIDAFRIAEEVGLGNRINVIMQTAFFKISSVIDIDQAVKAIKDAIKKTYGKKGEKIVQMNFAAVDQALEKVYQVKVPSKATSRIHMAKIVPDDAPEFVRTVTAEIMAGRGDKLPVSKMPCDGKFPTGTTQYEKRNIAVYIPVWEPQLCLQCGQCSFVCPHAAIRIKAYDPSCLKTAPAAFKSTDAKGKEFAGMKFTVQVAPEDCTGCEACVINCPGMERDANKQPTGRKAINMALQEPLRMQERENFKFFLSIPNTDPNKFKIASIKGSQLVPPLFEFSGACAGCGETANIKLLTQLFGDRLYIANATGCSSIYGGNLPTTPYTKRADGRGPTWSNSLFEDNAEFGFGMRLAINKMMTHALELLEQVSSAGCVSKDLADALKEGMNTQDTQAGIEQQRARVEELKAACRKSRCPECERLLTVADYLVRKSVWIVGGDGWAYDIGYGGLDHVLASGENINALVLDTEVYSNTGGQMSKATPLGAVAQFASGGKRLPKKDMGLIAMTYGNIYVASIAIGANPNQAVKAFAEAESYEGPSLILSYCHCIAHGLEHMGRGYEEQKKAVACGHWPLYRFDPRLAQQGKNPLQMDSKAPTIDYAEYASGENRFRILQKTKPEIAQELLEKARQHVKRKYALYEKLSQLEC